MGLTSSRRYRGSPLYGPTVVEPAVPGRVGVGFNTGPAVPTAWATTTPLMPSFGTAPMAPMVETVVPPMMMPPAYATTSPPMMPPSYASPYAATTTYGGVYPGLATPPIMLPPSFYPGYQRTSSGVGVYGNMGANIGSLGAGVGFGLGGSGVGSAPTTTPVTTTTTVSSSLPYTAVGGTGMGYSTPANVGGYGVVSPPMPISIAAPMTNPTMMQPTTFPMPPPPTAYQPTPVIQQAPVPNCDCESFLITIRSAYVPCTPPQQPPMPPPPPPPPAPMPPYQPVVFIPMIPVLPQPVQVPQPLPQAVPVPQPIPQPYPVAVPQPVPVPQPIPQPYPVAVPQPIVQRPITTWSSLPLCPPGVMIPVAPNYTYNPMIDC